MLDARRRVAHRHQVRRAVALEEVVGLRVGETVEAVEGARIGARGQRADVRLEAVVLREVLEVVLRIGGGVDERHPPGIGLGAGAAHVHRVDGH